MDNEFLLMDRIQKIQQVIGKYGEENFYLSFSGGKDSTVLSALLDMAVPGNKIPRVYANTGIEYQLILDFVEKMRGGNHSWELIIIKPNVPIKQMLEKEGYPFKSKRHSSYLARYQKRGLKHAERTYLGMEESLNGNKWRGDRVCPKSLLYQFTDDFTQILKVSDKCCKRLKTDRMKEYEKESGKKYAILGIMPSEGGRRERAKCLAFRGGKFKAFQPLVPVTKEWEDWFIEEYNIDISDIYKEPYNFTRTGCKGCPFNVHIQRELDTLKHFFPNEYKQCEAIWKPVYDEYRRLGYRLRKPDGQMTLEDMFNLNEKEDEDG